MKSDSIHEEQLKKTLEKVSQYRNIIDEPLFNLEKKQEVKIEIKVDNSIEHGLFKPSKVINGLWYASAQTYRAMKKDLFSFGESIDEIAEPYQCHSCHTNLDKQFWFFCPYCGESFLGE